MELHVAAGWWQAGREGAFTDADHLQDAEIDTMAQTTVMALRDNREAIRSLKIKAMTAKM